MDEYKLSINLDATQLPIWHLVDDNSEANSDILSIYTQVPTSLLQYSHNIQYQLMEAKCAT